MPAPVSEEAKLAWFKEAKFGLFIHWGLYSIPAGDWKGQRAPGLGEWIMHNAPIPVTEYEKFAPQFDPEQFDALHLLGVLKLQQGNAAAAEMLISRALKARPESVEALCNLSAALLALDRHADALAAKRAMEWRCALAPR